MAMAGDIHRLPPVGHGVVGTASSATQPYGSVPILCIPLHDTSMSSALPSPRARAALAARWWIISPAFPWEAVTGSAHGGGSRGGGAGAAGHRAGDSEGGGGCAEPGLIQRCQGCCAAFGHSLCLGNQVWVFFFSPSNCTHLRQTDCFTSERACEALCGNQRIPGHFPMPMLHPTEPRASPISLGIRYGAPSRAEVRSLQQCSLWHRSPGATMCPWYVTAQECLQRDLPSCLVTHSHIQTWL